MSCHKDTSVAVNERVTGCVKWFNTKSGYGFITVNSGAHKGVDIFVHHSAVNVGSQQYKYLVQGEYVELTVEHTPDSKYDNQSVNVSGINGGKLMCETRHEFKMSRLNYRQSKSADDAVEEVKMPVQNTTRIRGEGPRSDNSEWNLVKNSKPVKPRGRPPSKKVESSVSA